MPIDGCFPLAKSFDHAGPMARDVDGCVRMMAALAPATEIPTVGDLADLRLGVAWTAHADPLVRERVEAAAAAFPNRVALDLPLPGMIYPMFSREAVEVHETLFREQRDALRRERRDEARGARWPSPTPRSRPPGPNATATASGSPR